jgi:hypothetical protein
LVGTSSASPQSIAISNTGTTDLSISSVLSTNPTDFSLSQNCTGAPLPPSPATGSSCSIDVTFHPASTGMKNTTLTITSDDPALPVAIYGVSGTGIQGDLDLNPTSLSFGSQAFATESAAQTITVTNNGTATVESDTTSNDSPNPAIAGPNASQFFVVANNCADPEEVVSLAPSESCTFGVVFTPTSLGAKSATVKLISDAPDSANDTATLSGTGVAPPATGDGSPPPPGTSSHKKCKKKHHRHKKCKKS